MGADRGERAGWKAGGGVMGHCKDCRWWEQNPEMPPIGECLLAGGEHEGRSLAQAIGRDPGEGWLSTSAEFGCVQFEAKV